MSGTATAGVGTFLTKAQLAEYLGVAVATIQHKRRILIAKGVTEIRIGNRPRYRKEDVDRLLAKCIETGDDLWEGNRKKKAAASDNGQDEAVAAANA